MTTADMSNVTDVRPLRRPPLAGRNLFTIARQLIPPEWPDESTSLWAASPSRRQRPLHADGRARRDADCSREAILSITNNIEGDRLSAWEACPVGGCVAGRWKIDVLWRTSATTRRWGGLDVRLTSFECTDQTGGIVRWRHWPSIKPILLTLRSLGV